jgi:hypothetical protein
MSGDELQRQAYEQRILEQEEIVNQLAEQVESYQNLLCFAIHKLGGVLIVSEHDVREMPKVGNLISNVDKKTGAIMVTYDVETSVDGGPAT